MLDCMRLSGQPRGDPAYRASMRNVGKPPDAGHSLAIRRTAGFDPNRTSRPAVLDSPQTRGIFVLDGGLLDSTLVRVAAVASAGMYDYALP